MLEIDDPFYIYLMKISPKVYFLPIGINIGSYPKPFFPFGFAEILPPLYLYTSNFFI